MPKPPPGICSPCTYQHDRASDSTKDRKKSVEWMKKRLTYSKIKLRAPNITPRIRRLHHHLLPLDRPARERKLVASTASRARAVDGREPVREVVADGPWRLVRAHVGRAAGAAGCGVLVAEGLVVDVAGFDGGGDARLVAPGAAGFAAVPGMGVSGRKRSEGGGGFGKRRRTSSEWWYRCRTERW